MSAIPVIFTSFGFHGSVPSIVSYMDGNVRKLRWVFITGSAIPLVAYIFWQVATLGSIDSTTFMGLLANHAGLNGLLQALREMVASPHVELAVHLFADLALATSFLGVALGLFDYLADLFQRSNTVGGRLQTGAITFLPPLAFALFYPRGFVMALGYAGVALAVLALIIPSLLTWQSRKHNPQAGYRVKGGRPALVVVFLCGIAVIGVQFLLRQGCYQKWGDQIASNSLLGARINADTQFDLLMQAALLKFLTTTARARIVTPRFLFCFDRLLNSFSCGCAIQYACRSSAASRMASTLSSNASGDIFSTRSKFSSVPCSAIASSAGFNESGNVDQSESATPAYSQSTTPQQSSARCHQLLASRITAQTAPGIRSDALRYRPYVEKPDS